MPNLNEVLVKKELEKKSTQELLDVLTYSQDDYQPEAIQIIKDILTSRSVSEDVIVKATADYNKIISNTAITGTQKRVPKINRFLLWTLYLAGLVMLRYIVKLITIGYLTYSTHSDSTNVNTDKWITLRKAIRTEADSLLKGDTAKDKWCSCMLSKFQAIYPLGDSSIPADSLKAQSFRFGTECGKTINIQLNGWNPNVIRSFKSALLLLPDVKKIKKEYQEPFCDCFIQQLQIIYPEGVNQKISQQVKDSVSLLCAKKITQ